MVKKGHKHMELAELAANTNPNVIGITETHLDSSFQDGEIDIPGYSIIRQDREREISRKKKGGGIVAYVREDIETENIVKKGCEDLEMVHLTSPAASGM